MTSLSDFNDMSTAEAADLLRPCLDVQRWIDEVTTGRPYPDRESLEDAARAAAEPLEREEIDAALSHHPRIGESASGTSTEADLSRAEQSTLDLDDSVTARLQEGNRTYEERFDRVFLIRAKGRTSSEILDQLEHRLGNDEETERRVVGEQLHEIAALRLSEAVQ